MPVQPESEGDPEQAILRRIFGENLESISRYVDILLLAGLDRGLLGPREVDRIWERHIFNSVAVRDLIPAGSTVADVGSGAGLPGVPLALARPDIQVTLIEPLLRRSAFLIETVAALGLDGRVRVLRDRAEEVRETFDVVTARAVAPLHRLIGWCGPLRAEGGLILALKGRAAAEEVRAASSQLRQGRLQADVLVVRADPATEPTTVVRIASAPHRRAARHEYR